MKKIAFAIIGSTLLSSTFATNAPSALKDYRLGQFTQAKPLLENLAAKKNATALYYLAKMNLYGYGTPRNPELGISLMKQAANLKSLPAQMYLGNYYFQDKKKLHDALVYYQKAANQGNINASMFTALCYIHGLCGEKKPDKAKRYIIKAAKSGIPMAQYELAKLFLNSKYKSDRKMGKIWMKKAAANNYPEAITQLASQQNSTVEKKENQNSKPTSSKEEENPSVTNETRWKEMVRALARANITLQNPTVITAQTGKIADTPKMVLFSKSLVIKADQGVLTPKEIPIDYLIAMGIKYNKTNASITPKPYPFTLPVGAKNNKEALTLLQRQATFGHAQALFQLGQMYASGIGVAQDQQKAFQLFLKAAKREHLKAEYMVGLYYYKGITVQPDLKKAYYWLEKAAFHGSAPAQLLAAHLTQSGPTKNTEQAIGFYHLAAENGIPSAQYFLAKLYVTKSLNQHDVFTPNPRDFKKAQALFKKAVDAGFKPAELDLAFFYAKKTASEDHQEFAYNIAHDYADQGNQSAKLLLAILYDRGIGTSVDESDARSIYKELAKQNNSIAELMLGSYYYLDEDIDDATTLLQKSAQQHNPYALYNLAIIERKNALATHHYKKFNALLKRASQLGFVRADILLADSALTHAKQSYSKKQAIQSIKRLAMKNNALAQLKLGVMYQSGSGVPRNHVQAYKWYKKAAEQDNPVAQYLLGYAYQTGSGVKSNPQKAVFYYRLAAKQDYAPALVALGYYYDMNKPNYSKAINYYQVAAKLHNKQAQYNLGVMYQYGKGVDSDEDKAQELKSP